MPRQSLVALLFVVCACAPRVPTVDPPTVSPPEQASHPPSPLDKLDPAKIDKDDHFANQPKELVAVLTGHTRTVAALAFAPDGVTLASSSLDGSVRLWKLDDAAPRELATLRASGSG